MRYIKALAVIVFAASLAGCAKATDSDAMCDGSYRDAEGNQIVFSGTVGKGYGEYTAKPDTGVSEGYFMPCTNGAYLIVSDNLGAATLTPAKGVDIDFGDYTTGDKIRITHGVILESYPSQTDLYSIEKLSDGELSDIPADTLANLKELGWLPEAE